MVQNKVLSIKVNLILFDYLRLQAQREKKSVSALVKELILKKMGGEI
jgi:predicted CopG family antitoxin